MDFSKKTLVELREIAKEKGLKGITALRKPELIQRLMEVSEETKREPEVMPERTMERKPVSQRDVYKRQGRCLPSLSVTAWKCCFVPCLDLRYIKG